MAERIMTFFEIITNFYLYTYLIMHQNVIVKTMIAKT